MARKPKNRIARFLTLLLALAWATAAAATLSACATAQAPGAAADEQALTELTSRDQWLRGLEHKLSNRLCSDGQLFRACYEVSESDCQETAYRVAASCETRFEDIIPESIGPEQGRQWGEEFGKCTGEQLYEALDAEYDFRETETCKRLLSVM